MEIATEHSEPLRSPVEPAPRRVRRRLRARRLAGWGGLAAIAAGAGAIGALTTRRRALVAGGTAALALGALRWQLARWFTDTPAYELETRIDRAGRIWAGGIELRHYPVQIEARTDLPGHDLESALAAGYGRLACYVYGANADRRELERTTPVLLGARDGIYSLAFVMPERDALPAPDDVRVELCAVPERRVAVLGFRGRWSRDNIARHERILIDEIARAGLPVQGGVTFACYDSPATLPALRRNELWIEVG